MDLKNKIIALYSSLNDEDFSIHGGTIILRNDGKGPYIAKWEHTTLARPTDAQLDAVTK
jgi:hypothetical protein